MKCSAVCVRINMKFIITYQTPQRLTRITNLNVHVRFRENNNNAVRMFSVANKQIDKYDAKARIQNAS